MSNTQPTQYDSINFVQYELAFRIAHGCWDAIPALTLMIDERLRIYVQHGRIHKHQKNGREHQVSTKQSDTSLVKCLSDVMRKARPTFRTDEVVPTSGIHRVRRKSHRLPHEVTLLKDQQFPRCSKCHDAVLFELLRPVSAYVDLKNKKSFRVLLYELPALEADQSFTGK
jgi:hypothetical protein